MKFGVLSTPPSLRELRQFLGLRSVDLPLQRPYVWTTSVASIDGRTSTQEADAEGGHAIASAGGKYDGLVDRKILEHGWKTADAILTTGEILRSEPMVTYRPSGARRKPLCVILTASGMIDLDHPVFRKNQTLTVTTKEGFRRLKGFRKSAARDMIVSDTNDDKVSLTWLLRYLRREKNVLFLDVNAGGRTISDFLSHRLVDEMRISLVGTILGRWNSQGQERSCLIDNPRETCYDLQNLPLLSFNEIRTTTDASHVFLRLRTSGS